MTLPSSTSRANSLRRFDFMRPKLCAVILALTVMSRAQTVTPTTASQTPAPADKARPSCCEKMANGSSPAFQGHKGGKEMASRCSGKDGASCGGGGADAQACRKDGECPAAGCK